MTAAATDHCRPSLAAQATAVRPSLQDERWKTTTPTFVMVMTHTLENPVQQTKEDLESHQLDLEHAKAYDMGRKVWNSIITRVHHPAALPEAYWLWGQHPPPVVSSGLQKI